MKGSWLRRWLKNYFRPYNRESLRQKKPILDLQFLECRTVPASLDVSSGTVSFTAGTGINDNLSVSLVSGKYAVSDSTDTISLSSAAIAAGWTGSGTHTVAGPSSNITLLNLNLANGADSLGSIIGGTANVSIAGTGSLDVAGLVETSGSIAISGVTNLTDTTGAGNLQAGTLTLSSSAGIGATGHNLIISGANPAITANSGSGGVLITSTDGETVSASASGAGNVLLTNTFGTMTIASAGIDAGAAKISGNIALSSSGSISLNGNIGSNSFSGTIAIAGDTSGTLTSSADAFQQNGQSLITTNTTTSAALIAVNTPASGSGTASIGEGSIGNNNGGAITINSYGGSIVWGYDTPAALTALGTWPSGDPRTGTTNGGGNSAVLSASNYVFAATGSSSEIGSEDRPIQTANYPSNKQTVASPTLGSASLTAGSNGIYFVDWSPGNVSNNNLTLNSAISTGDIRVVTAQAVGHGMFVDGPVWAGSRNIDLYSDDDLTLQSATIGGVYQDNSFSGKIDLDANRDEENGETLAMMDGSSIATTNSTNGNNYAIRLNVAPYSGSNDDVDLLIPAGGIDLENVTCGNGGNIIVDAAGGLNSGEQGSIIEQQYTSIDAGVSGTVTLTAQSWDTSNNNLVGGIGVAGTPSNPIDYPINITAGTIVATTTGTSLANSGSIDIVALSPASFTANTSGNSSASIVLADSSTTGPLIISSVSTGAGNQDGGPVIVTGTDAGGGVVVNGTLGSSTTGAIAVNGPLSGTGSIVLGTNKLTVNQDTASEFDGTISGPHSILVEGGGTLTLTGNESYTGSTTIDSGTTLLVNGSIAASSGETVSAGAILGGNGGTGGNVAVSGILAPGNVGSAGILNTGSLTFSSGSAFDAYLNGGTPGSGFSRAVASGAISLNNAALNLSIGSNLSITQPEQFDILMNKSGQPINGTFLNLPEGAFGTTSTGQKFQITYHGGSSGNDVVVTLFPLQG